MTIEEVATYIKDGGQRYLLQFGFDSEEIDDPILREKWNQATKLLQEIRSMLPEPHEDDDE